MLKHENVMRVIALWKAMRVECGPCTVSLTLHDVDVDDVKDSEGCVWIRSHISNGGMRFQAARLDVYEGGGYGSVTLIGPLV